MSAPVRVQLSRARGWRKPENTVVVARPSKFGNPFRLRDETHGLVRYRLEAPDEIDYEGRISHDGNMHPWYGPEGTVVPFYVRYATAAEIVWMFRRTLLDPTPSMRMAYPSGSGRFAKVTVEEIRAELAGKNLACWCPLVDTDGNPVPCHADVLLELANTPAGAIA